MADYHTYMKSKKWKRIRENYWASDRLKKCFICSIERNPHFHLHHLTYDRFGNEELDDLVPVCSPCHTKIHQIEKFHPDKTIKEVTLLVHSQNAGRRENEERKQKST